MKHEDTWDEWKHKQEEKQADKLRSLSDIKRPITDVEKRNIIALADCHFLPGSWDKRFIKSLRVNVQIDDVWQPVPVDEITPKQAYWLNRLVYRYRKQLGLTPEQARYYARVTDEK